MKKDEELVACIHRTDFFSKVIPYFSGFKGLPGIFSSVFINNIQGSVVYSFRRDCEKNPNYKQIIPYCLLCCDGKFFVMHRKDAGGEKRLHGRSSLGVGGHMNPIPEIASVKTLIAENIIREITEEVAITDVAGKETRFDFPKLVGLLNDDDNEVGAVHLGVFFILNLPADGTIVKVRETDQLAGKFMSLPEIQDLPNLEPWSEIIVTQYLLKTYKRSSWSK